MVVTSVTGHLMELDFGDGHRKWGSCDPVELFDAPVFMGVPDEKKDLEAQLQQALKEANGRCERQVAEFRKAAEATAARARSGRGRWRS